MIDTLPDINNLTFEKVWFMFQETDRKFKETDLQIKQTSKEIKELGRQIGGLGNKFGSFNEGLLMPSLIKLLETKFNCYDISTNRLFRDNGKSFEVDILGANDDSCYLIEIKSHLKEEAIEQLKKQIDRFKKFGKNYTNSKIYGVICATHYEINIVEKVTEAGLYFISTSDDLIKLQVPDNFEPRIF